MNTTLGNQAINNINKFKNHCINDEFKTFEDGIKEFDRLMSQGDKFNQIQAKVKLNNISKLDFKGFASCIYVYFGRDILKS